MGEGRVGFASREAQPLLLGKSNRVSGLHSPTKVEGKEE